MKRIVYSNKYKKDLKKYINQPEKLKKLNQVIQMLERENPLPSNYKMHRLSGCYKGCLECHVGNDFLLVWVSKDEITLVRLGSHSELF